MQVLRCRKKRRRSSKRWARPSACSQTQRRNPATTAVRIWRMTAWTWEVSAWEYWGVGVFPDTGDTSIMYLGLRLWIFLKLLLWNYQWFCWFSVIFLLPDFDANNIFKAFFGGPGGFSFEGIYMNVCFYKNHSDCERLLLMSPVCLSVCLQHPDQEISSSSLVKCRIHLHQVTSAASTSPSPPTHHPYLMTGHKARFFSMP